MSNDARGALSCPETLELETMPSKTKKDRVPRLPRVVDTSQLDDDAHVKIHTVSRETGLATGTIRNLIARKPPGFPSPVPKDGRPGPNYWRLGDIRDYLRSNRGRK